MFHSHRNTLRAPSPHHSSDHRHTAAPATNLEAVVEVLGFGLDLLGVLQHSFIQHQSLTPLLHQHIRLGYEETSTKAQHGNHELFIGQTWFSAVREQRSPVGLVDQSLEGHLLLEGVIILQTLQGRQLSQTLQPDQAEGDEERQRQTPSVSHRLGLTCRMMS